MTSDHGDKNDDGDSGSGKNRGDSALTEQPRPVVCAHCGTTSPDPQPTWTCSVENGARHYFCDTCARANLRAIEGRLDSGWW
ncbi:hypothetical protein [Streptomyces fructofermentans]|uniref:Uncharacterized protein n=1 Tax=Streptomyces fructofermentans TaxID=152141 RepID=A0A918N5Y0_9ACTN|nr:hypothetical protein [Streptomyces fructofermentans]GGX40642.1 hypothetical protein GCM10010515_04300 [Streptomyces fructofermentans]